jgi:lipoprotein signal peptidase
VPERSYRRWLYVLAALGLTLDLGSKYGVFAWLAERPGNTFPVFQDARREGFVLIAQFERDGQGRKVPHVNHGALFSFLRDYESRANAGFAAVSVLAALAVVLWATQRSTAGDRLMCVSLGLILGGTLGNLYDRLVFNGVRDFLYWNYLFDWPVFNVADSCLVCGAGLLLAQAFFGRQAQAETRPPAREARPAGAR